MTIFDKQNRKAAPSVVGVAHQVGPLHNFCLVSSVLERENRTLRSYTILEFLVAIKSSLSATG